MKDTTYLYIYTVTVILITLIGVDIVRGTWSLWTYFELLGVIILFGSVIRWIYGDMTTEEIS